MIAHTETLSLLPVVVPWVGRAYVYRKHDKMLRALECCAHCCTTRHASNRMVLHTKCSIHGSHKYAIKLERSTMAAFNLNAYKIR